MPVFEYRCGSCGLEFEKIVRSGMTVVCTSCGSAELEKKVSMFAARSEGREIAGGAKKHCSTCAGGHCSSCH